ncbi:MAG: GntR family transcriptional regulator [Alteromonas sp.]|nr:GntR family transcriptional regulator [Alteromonas sp.]
MLKIGRPKTLKENVLISLRDAITQGELKPGERLVERNLCESMEVSRTVVRECIRHLESEWLIVGTPNAGFTVATIDSDVVSEIYQIRSMLECSAVKSCASNADAQTVSQLRELSQSISDCLQNEDVLQALKFTTEFYRTIFTTSRKNVSWALVERLNGRISRLRALTLSSKTRRIQGPRNLSSIVDAIEQRDSKRAHEVCARHLNEAAQIALKLI